MSFKEYLLTLKWNSFSTYPKQGENIFLYCTSADGNLHKFVKIICFNAVKLDFDKIHKIVSPNQQWLYTWLPADAIKYNHE